MSALILILLPSFLLLSCMYYIRYSILENAKKKEPDSSSQPIIQPINGEIESSIESGSAASKINEQIDRRKISEQHSCGTKKFEKKQQCLNGGGVTDIKSKYDDPKVVEVNNTSKTLMEVQNLGVVVLSADELTPIQDLAEAKDLVLNSFFSDDWVEKHTGTLLIRRFLRFHSPSIVSEGDLGFVYENFDLVLSLLAEGVGSLRSAISRNALFAIDEIFQHLGGVKNYWEIFTKANSDIIEALTDAVVLKAVNDKRFIAAAGESVVKKMVLAIPSLTILQPLLRHSGSKNPKVCLVVGRYGCSCLKDILSDPEKARLVSNKAVSTQLILSFCELERSRSAEAKKYAEKSLRLLYTSLTPSLFETVVAETMSDALAAHALSIVKTCRRDSVIPRKRSIKEMKAEKRRQLMSGAS